MAGMDQAQNLRNIINSAELSISKTTTARVLTVTSGKGGVGKSNVAINLAVQFKKQGKRVIILDADFGLANIEIMFGAIPRYHLGDLIKKGRPLNEIITWGPMGIGFISGGSGILGMSNLKQDELRQIISSLNELDDLADIVIIDTGAGISDAVMEFLLASAEVILVTTLEPTSITDAYSLVKALSSHSRFKKNHTCMNVIINRAANEGDGKSLADKLNTVVSRYLNLELSYLGTIPQDAWLERAIMQQMPVSMHYPTARSSRAFELIAHRLLNANMEKSTRSSMAVFISRIFGK